MRAGHILIFCIVLALGIVGYGFLNGDGYSKTKRLDKETEVLRDRLSDLKAENERLTQEVRSLQDDGDKKKLEQVVREELGYVKADETVLLVAPNSSAQR